MCDLVVLSRWINASLRSKQPFARHLLQAQAAEVLDLAEHAGIFRNAGLQTHVTCTACDDPHASPVLRSPEGQFGHYCLRNGRIPLGLDEIALVALDRAALLRVLASGAGLPPNKCRSYADGRLVYLGIVDSDSRAPWVLGYADRLEDTNVQASVIAELAERFPKGPGLISTPSAVPLNMPLPGGFKLAALDELFAAVGDGMVLDAAHAETRLGTRKKVPGAPGRPTMRAIIRDIWLNERDDDDWPQSRQDQASYVLAHWPEAASSRPSPKTVMHHLKEFEHDGASDE